MNKTNLIKLGLMNAIGTLAYIVVVAFIMTNFEKSPSVPKGLFVPIAMLLLFVTSAAVTGSLVIGKPIMLYIDNQKNNAIKLFCYTLLWLVIFTFIALSLRMVY